MNRKRIIFAIVTVLGATLIALMVALTRNQPIATTPIDRTAAEAEAEAKAKTMSEKLSAWRESERKRQSGER